MLAAAEFLGAAGGELERLWAHRFLVEVSAELIAYLMPWLAAFKKAVMEV